MTLRVLLSFCLLIIIFIIFGLFTFNSINNISHYTHVVNDHPLIVSNTALLSHISILKMYRYINEVLLLEDKDQIQRYATYLNQEERQAYDLLDILKEKITGEKGKKLENEVRLLFDAWRPIREQILNLVLAGQRNKAVETALGKGNPLVAELQKRIMILTDYAKENASTFMLNTEKMLTRLTLASILFLLSIIIVSCLVAYQTIHRTAAAEKLLNENEEKFRSMSSSVKDALITLDNNGRITFWNEAAELIFGYNEKEVLGRDLHGLIAPEKFSESYKTGLQQFKASGEGAAIGKTLELAALRKEGTQFPIELSLSSYHAAGRWHAVGTVRDISERKLAEQEKENLIADLKKALAEVKKLSGMLPICSACKKIRDDKGYWKQIESYIRDHSDAEFSHSICPDCSEKLYPGLFDDD